MVLYSNGGLKTGLKKPVYGPKCPAFKWFVKSRDYHLNTKHLYSPVSDESGIQVFSIQMVTVKWSKLLKPIQIQGSASNSRKLRAWLSLMWDLNN